MLLPFLLHIIICRAFLHGEPRQRHPSSRHRHRFGTMNTARVDAGELRTEDDDVRMQALAQGRLFVSSLLNAHVDPIPNSGGMRVVRGVLDLETGATHDIILRNITVPFWEACLKVVNRPNSRTRVAAVGNPGIGKTVSTAWLIRMLLEQRQTVVYLIRTIDSSSWYYEFVPKSDGRVTTNVYPETIQKCFIPSLELPSSYYIVDPGRTRDSCSPGSLFQAKFILVPSPCSGHWGESDFSKRRDDVSGTFLYFPTWSYDELVHARPILRTNMTNDEVRDRFRQFGGVPGHVFALKVDGLLHAQDRAVNSLSAYRAAQIAWNQVNALDKYGKEPKSSLLAIQLSAEDGGEFSMRETFIVSQLVSEKIYSKFQRQLWRHMLEVAPSGRRGRMFEMIMRHRIANGEPPSDFLCRRCVGESDREYSDLFWRTLGTGNKDIWQVADPPQAAADCENVVFHPLRPTWFHFLYKDSAGHFHVFYASVSQWQTELDPAEIKDLEEKVGDASKLSIYDLVPSTMFPAFVTKPPNPSEVVDVEVSCQVYYVSIPKPGVA